MGKLRADGSIEHPYSALNLRLALALFGAVTMVAATVVLLWLGHTGLALVAAVIAVVATANAAIVQVRRRQRARREGETDTGPARHSLFE